MSRHSKLSYKASILIDVASLTDEGTKFLDEQLDFIDSKLKEMGVSSTTEYGSQRRKISDKAINIGDPCQIRAKECVDADCHLACVLLVAAQPDLSYYLSTWLNVSVDFDEILKSHLIR
ncbi:hypothetical protein SASPL_120353 [Salvia splendens]|uniref:Uncharacterized protein n=1 Tax=Salvia splendens TaxID=180675 RepID=A0A8X8ZW58_SALSN|nr:hypothetical protein SASPL_120353 [Salvia splendens]